MVDNMRLTLVQYNIRQPLTNQPPLRESFVGSRVNERFQLLS